MTKLHRAEDRYRGTARARRLALETGDVVNSLQGCDAVMAARGNAVGRREAQRSQRERLAA